MLLGLGGVLAYLLTRSRKTEEAGIALPANLNAFTVLELLQGMRDGGKLTPPQRQQTRPGDRRHRALLLLGGPQRRPGPRPARHRHPLGGHRRAVSGLV